ncbi:MAG: aminoacyl-tRNA hydrolase [Xanthomonadales bacterium]|nr:aminoacyl-tRNA hydrolase [Xanthomonadales bacterium]
MSGTFLIIGLGNPGSDYDQTRHNAGFWFLDALNNGSGFRKQSRLSAEVCRTRLHERDCLLAKPAVFMNHSGRAVRAVMDYYRVSAGNVLVAYDELDLPPGTARLKQGGGHGGHNGMRDIFRHLDDTGFLRLRIGIGHPGHKDAVTNYVLGRPTLKQEVAIRYSISEAVAVMPDLLSGNVAKAMKDLHTAEDDQPAAESGD